MNLFKKPQQKTQKRYSLKQRLHPRSLGFDWRIPRCYQSKGTRMNQLKALWCELFHGGGTVKHDSLDRINWQCGKCGRWCYPVSEQGDKND